MENLIKPKRALISVSDKANLEILLPVLARNNIEIISTGGTAEYIRQRGFDIIPIEKVTGNPEIFDGRVKTLSFQISSALLYRRDNLTDQENIQKLKIPEIDIVICNLYPFQKVAQKKDVSIEELIENIDIGGPSMIRSAAKNMKWVTVVTDPMDYEKLAHELIHGGISYNFRVESALKAISMTAQYDLNIATKMSTVFEKEFPSVFSSEFKDLRYGENPHQKAKLFVINNQNGNTSLANAPVIQGKEISYNNYLDSDQAFKCASELFENYPALCSAVIVKHGIPCGVASGINQLETLKIAWDCDSTSAFGGIVCLTQKVNKDTAQWLVDHFIEVLIAPEFDQSVRDIFAAKKNVRLLEVPMKKMSQEWCVRSINGGILWQQEDENLPREFQLKTKREFSSIYLNRLKFGSIVTKYLKSNCLVLIGERSGSFYIHASGVGQPNRLECLSLLAGPRAKNKETNFSELILFSDAFFPFKDSIEEAHKWGIKYIVQPGGSIRDQEVIDACDIYGMSMVMTGERHFRH